MNAFADLLRETFVTCAVLTLPVVIGATLIGTLVAIVQAATQVQEQTLSLLPKLIVVGAIVAAGGAFAMQLCAHLFMRALEAIPQLVRGG